ncbi:Dyp-type peroxidase [Geodermatophilus sp. SYSU D01176]
MEKVPTVDLSDIQGLVVRGYGMPTACHLLVRVDSAPDARALLGQLVDGTPGRPQVTTATSWRDKPESCLNVSVTAAGLDALGVSPQQAGFPEDFTQGAAARADLAGDVGPNDPAHWRPVFTDPGLHLVFSLSGQSRQALERAEGDLLAGTAPGLAVLDRLVCDRLPGRVDHFGYTQGISQPTIDEAPPSGAPDHMPEAPTGAFLLGHPGPHTRYSYPVPQPEALGHNGTYAALRVLAQDVGAFREMLSEQCERTGMSEELIAAKLCGRWRNGTPLALSPDSPRPLPRQQQNDFDYAGDVRGDRCPVGAHVRRMYPRNSQVAGGRPHQRRIIRRGLTYGPPYDPDRPDDGYERGIVGLFIGASLTDQFEFLVGEWGRNGLFAPGLGRTQDAFLGSGRPDAATAPAETDGAAGTFLLRRAGVGTKLTDLPRLVTTRGGAYCFMPSLTAIRYLATR